ncbi:unnamed protein product [Paramecium primaurelia]|uniref:EF-hand domain-containing protein n=3 Tax=Paramecium TaxID=5884 RepID=A0A8S1X9U7_PAROT|nr:unnamed protein product [Paramecium primaurelia]CAD8197827.1 unnamed protein product [Paramecium octaurelia]CAD8202511.1 unnamed protein product [Paramecium pentaurelia]
MGPTQGKELSPQMRDRVLKLFARFDVDGSKSIEKSETIKYWKSNFAKLNTEELFKSVDTDNSGTISEEEWLNFWTSVLRSGHTEEEISDELESIESGSSWVKFENLDKKKG